MSTLPLKPSPLALKLAARLHGSPRRPESVLAEEIETILHWHEVNEWTRIREANKLVPRFSDNVCVRRSRYSDIRHTGNEFFALELAPPEPDLPHEVQLKRYIVPGRCWTYAFQWQPSAGVGQGPRVVYGSEGNTPIAAALKLLVADLDRPQVVALFEEAFGAERIVVRYHRDTLALLAALAPRSLTYRRTARLIETTLAARRARIETERASNAASLAPSP
jgi:hypothetical protein